MKKISRKQIRLALGAYRISMKIAADEKKKEESFEEAVKGEKFKNPETGNDVNFSSLPAEEQKKIRDQWKKKNDALELSDEDKKLMEEFRELDLSEEEIFDLFSAIADTADVVDDDALEELKDMDGEELEDQLEALMTNYGDEDLTKAIEDALNEISDEDEDEDEEETPSWRKNKDKKLPDREQNWVNSISDFDGEDFDLKSLNNSLAELIDEDDPSGRFDDLKEAFPNAYITLKNLSREEAMELLKEVMSRDAEEGVSIAQFVKENSEGNKFTRLSKPAEQLEKDHEEALGGLFSDLTSHLDPHSEENENLNWQAYEAMENAVRIDSLEELQEASFSTLTWLGAEKIKKIVDAEKKFREDQKKSVEGLMDEFTERELNLFGFSVKDRGDLSSLEENLNELLEREKEKKDKKERKEMLKKNKEQSSEDRAKEVSSITSKAGEAMKNPPNSTGGMRDQIDGFAKDIMDQFGVEGRLDVRSLGEEGLDQLLESFESLNTSIKESFSKEKEKAIKENEKAIKELEPTHKEAESRVEEAQKRVDEAMAVYERGLERGRGFVPPSHRRALERSQDALHKARENMSKIQAQMDAIALPPEKENMVASYGGSASLVLQEALEQKAKITKDKADAAEAKRLEEAQKKEEEERKAKIKEYEGKIKDLLSKAQGAKERKEIKPLYNEIGSIKGQLSNSDMLGSLTQSIQQVEDALKEKSEELSFGSSLKKFLGLKPRKKAQQKVAKIALELLKEEIALYKEEEARRNRKR